MVEEEVKKKWCPFSRIVPDAQGYASGNRFGVETLDNGCNCIGSRCMVWRVLEKERPPEKEVKFIEWWDGDEKPSAPSEDDGWSLTDKGHDDPDEQDDKAYLWEEYSREKKPSTPETGYCGLAGKP